jgi:hypothetical protein
MISDLTCFLRLQIQALGFTLSLRLKNTLPCCTEVLHVDPHTTLAERHETSLGADGLDVSTLIEPRLNTGTTLVDLLGTVGTERISSKLMCLP